MVRGANATCRTCSAHARRGRRGFCGEGVRTARECLFVKPCWRCHEGQWRWSGGARPGCASWMGGAPCNFLIPTRSSPGPHVVGIVMHCSLRSCCVRMRSLRSEALLRRGSAKGRSCPDTWFRLGTVQTLPSTQAVDPNAAGAAPSHQGRGNRKNVFATTTALLLTL